MRMVRGMKISLAVICISLFHLLVPYNAKAQTYSYKTYDLTTGLPGSYLNTIGQDKGGFLWVGLETGLFRFDGFNFYRMNLPDTISSGYPNALFCDSSGTMWIGFTDGSLFKWSSGSTLTRLKDIEADRINKIMSGPDGKTWIVSQTKGIYVSVEEGSDKMRKISTPEGIVIFDIAFIGEDSLLVATQDNLHICKIQDDQIIITDSFKDLEYTWVQSVVSLPGGKWAAGTDGAGLFIISRNDGLFTARQVTGYSSLEGVRIPAVISDSGNSLLAATREAGVVKITFNDDFSSVMSIGSYDIISGLPDNDVRILFKDREGNLWIGLFNRGLAAVTTNAFSFFSPGENREISFIGEGYNKVIMGTRTGLYDFDPETGRFSNFRDLNRKTGGSGITAWKSDKEGDIWIGTANDGLYLLNKSGVLRSFYRSGNPGQDHINGIDTDDRNIWLATLNGVVLVDRQTGRLKRAFTTWDKLPHNNISQVISVNEGEILVATETDRLCYINDTGSVTTSGLMMEGSMRNRIQSISLSQSNGSVCVGTLGNGLFRFRADTLLNISTNDGLLSNYCYSVLIASDGRIWTGHEKGFSVINFSAGLVRTFSRDFGVKGDCLPNAITETSDGIIYIGTTEGVVVYNPKMEQKKPAPPQAGIIAVKINGVDYPYRTSYNLPYRSSYKVEVNYAGIFLRDPLNVAYRTRLGNFDDDWGETTSERSKTYVLRDGHYHFVVEALARDNPSAKTQASFDLVIQKPFTRSWWFIMLMLVTVSGIVYIIIILRERAHKRQREFLEQELQKRTAEVHVQKEELFQKNLDITESIKYAKRIQTSVLPDTSKLGSVFKEAFVFFLPRDIVSGDFYWFDWIDKEKFIVVCADSTGHGVPGAFMSMIGTALLQDIITRKKIVKPSQILSELDRQIFATLNQNQEVEAANDGMDIVVCEFNLKTRHLVFASAMRPVILVIDGEQQYIRGNRSAVGGESASEKFFNDQEYYLKEGDMVYLFTDGFPDQFGGMGSKKMKISRLRYLIDEIKSLPMAEQYLGLRDYFYKWKGENEQVDDVLIMAIKV